MWIALFPNWKSYRYVFLKEEGRTILSFLLEHNFYLECQKIPKGQRNFILTFLENPEKRLFLKLFRPGTLKRNRPKAYLKAYSILQKISAPLLSPYFVFWKNPLLCLLLKESFYGGMIFPYLEKGFLFESSFIQSLESGQNLLKKLLSFLYQLHERGVYLRDTKFTNFYYTKEEGFKIFDLEGISFLSSPLSTFHRLKDLAPLAMSLEWIGIPDVRESLWRIYKNFYPRLTVKDYLLYQRLIEEKKKRRERKLRKAKK